MITDAMITYFCPACWREIDRDAVRCPACGYDMMEHSRLPYEQKLILALRHPIRENRLIAVQLLGNLRSGDALPYFKTMLEGENDFYLLRAVLIALAKIGSPESRAVVSEATKHDSTLIREFATRLMSRRGQE
jgi:DNA-directed RNA polymerase subunit RPC12/RpoP